MKLQNVIGVACWVKKMTLIRTDGMEKSTTNIPSNAVLLSFQMNDISAVFQLLTSKFETLAEIPNNCRVRK